MDNHHHQKRVLSSINTNKNLSDILFPSPPMKRRRVTTDNTINNNNTNHTYYSPDHDDCQINQTNTNHLNLLNIIPVLPPISTKKVNNYGIFQSSSSSSSLITTPTLNNSKNYMSGAINADLDIHPSTFRIPSRYYNFSSNSSTNLNSNSIATSSASTIYSPLKHPFLPLPSFTSAALPNFSTMQSKSALLQIFNKTIADKDIPLLPPPKPMLPSLVKQCGDDILKNGSGSDICIINGYRSQVISLCTSDESQSAIAHANGKQKKEKHKKYYQNNIKRITEEKCNKYISYYNGMNDDLKYDFIPDEQNTKNNNLYSHDAKGYLIYEQGLCVGNNRFVIEKKLGSGTFSKVYKCYDRCVINCNVNDHDFYQKQHQQKYKALKIIRNQKNYRNAAKTEIALLKRIVQSDTSNSSCCIHLLMNFEFNNHPILVFPLLGRSLYSYQMQILKQKSFPDSEIKHILQQMAIGVSFIHNLNLIITDLKPENMVLVKDEYYKNTNTSQKHLFCTDIKLIDFGSAVYEYVPNTTANVVHKHLIQTRHYRAPEVICGMQWNSAADVWSMGCCLIEFVSGRMLFNTHDEIDHLKQITKCIGHMSRYFFENIDNEMHARYFKEVVGSDDGSEDGYAITDYWYKHGKQKKYHRRRNRIDCRINHLYGYQFRTAQKISSIQCSRLETYFMDESESSKLLLDLAKKMLEWDPLKRISAADVLKHPYFYLK